MAYLYGMIYLIMTSFPTVWTDIYGESIGTGGLNYIAIGIGFFLGSQIGSRLSDVIYRRLKLKNNNTGRPEFRVPLMFVGSLITPIGIFIYGWTAQYKTQPFY